MNLPIACSTTRCRISIWPLGLHDQIPLRFDKVESVRRWSLQVAEDYKRDTGFEPATSTSANTSRPFLFPSATLPLSSIRWSLKYPDCIGIATTTAREGLTFQNCALCGMAL